MGLFSKIKNFFNSKKSASKKIEKINTENAAVEQTTFDNGLHRSSDLLSSSVNEIAKKYVKVDDELIQKIEEMLISFDVGAAASQKILNAIVEEIKFHNVVDGNLIKEIILDKLLVYYIQDTEIFNGLNISKEPGNVILVSGVNGVGKTTTIAKLANLFKKQGKSVLLVAADTFRAGAVTQLKIWAERLGVGFLPPSTVGQDPASVIFKGMEMCKKDNYDIVLCDTSGRLQNKTNLMNELKKIHSIIKRFFPSQPCESLLVLDATTGQSGVAQARSFLEVANLTGIIITKLDSTSKGGIVLAIKDSFNLPVKFIGFGETINDLSEFDLEMFVHGLLKSSDIDKTK